MNKNSLTRRLLCFLLMTLVTLQPVLAMAQETSGTQEPTSNKTEAAQDVKYVAVATVALKMRRTPNADAYGCGSIPANAYVYILELEDEWCKVRTDRNDGYVMTKYLDDVREYTGTLETGKLIETPEEEVQPNQAAFGGKEAFREGYYAYAVAHAGMYEQPDERSRRISSVPTYKQVIVSVVEGDWCFAKFGEKYGYIRCDNLFKWDRIDPYAGEIPGLEIQPQLVFVNHTTDIYSMEDNSVLATVNPGAAICTQKLDAQGRYPLPYWRTTGYIHEKDVAYILPVVPYEEAKVGDLISVMTTYYAVGIHTVNYQGRNWNIRLSSSLINGTVLQPGEEYNQNSVIGPYLKSTGYHRAPIMSPHALWGYGGGTCQVNTTFYITTIQLPLLVPHRRVHADVGIYYAKKGFDAAVGGGAINLLMKNTLPFAIRYQFFISDGVLTCGIFKES
ncbi:MAG: VanW family protein [Clostridia bacterium]